MNTKAQRVPVSVIIPVKNEEQNLPKTLASVDWADEIWVVDSHSTDKTVQISEAAGARVAQFDYRGSWPKKKNWALETLPFRNEWILIVDADERIPPELRDELAAAIQKPEFDGYYLNRKFIFLGTWIKHCGWYPSWNLRLFKHKLGRYEFLGAGTQDTNTGDNEVHEHVVLKGKAGYLKNDMLHEDFKNLYHWLERHNRYSSWDAQVYQNLRSNGDQSSIGAKAFGDPLQRKRFIKKLWTRLPFRPTIKFLWMYFVRLGFMDGRAGYYYSRLHSHYEFNIKVKMYELSMNSKDSDLAAERNKAASTSA